AGRYLPGAGWKSASGGRSGPDFGDQDIHREFGKECAAREARVFTQLAEVFGPCLDICKADGARMECQTKCELRQRPVFADAVPVRPFAEGDGLGHSLNLASPVRLPHPVAETR